MSCPICEHDGMEVRFRWTEPPEGETRFELPDGESYDREFLECPECGHFAARLALDIEEIYSSAYVDSTYGHGIEADYDRIMSLPPERSDNVQRVERVDAWMRARGDGEHSLLDIGSGLCVFAARMKERGWTATVIDPDPRAAAHARERVGVVALEGDFFDLEPARRFQLVTLNKVLEHVANPTAMLARTGAFLAEGGAVYVEVPDGEAAAEAGGEGREEFFIEHLHAFSAASLQLLARRANFSVESLERLREPSDKYTLTAFLS